MSIAWLFPEYRFESTDAETHESVVIERVLERGTWPELRWLFDYLWREPDRRLAATTRVPIIVAAIVHRVAAGVRDREVYCPDLGCGSKGDGMKRYCEDAAVRLVRRRLGR
jgi:hypothetical protein